MIKINIKILVSFVMASVTFCSAADHEAENQGPRGRNNSANKQNRINPAEQLKLLKQQEKEAKAALRDKKLAEEKIEEAKRLALAAERQAKEKQRFDEECAKRSAEHLEQQAQADREKAERLKEKHKMKQAKLIEEEEARKIAEREAEEKKQAERAEEARKIAKKKKKQANREAKAKMNERIEESMSSIQFEGIRPSACSDVHGERETLKLLNGNTHHDSHSSPNVLTPQLKGSNGRLVFDHEGIHFKEIDASIISKMTSGYNALKQNPLLVRTNVTMMTTNTCKYQHIQNNDSFHLISSNEPLTIENTVIESENIFILSEHITCDAFFITNKPITLAFPGNSLSQFRYVKLSPLPITNGLQAIYIHADIAYSPYIQSPNTISYNGIAKIEFLKRF